MDEPKLAEELEKMDVAYEPVLPIEKKLIIWSIGIGVVALALLVAISETLFKN